MNKDIVLKLSKIQKELKAPKGQRNSFGNYNYRSCEDILEAVKPLLGNLIITISDEIVHIPYSSEPKVIEMTDNKGNKYTEIIGGDRFYIKATATITDGEFSLSNSAFARESQNKRGMDDSQITGATSSYARKYALNGLLLIDDTKDADIQDNSEKTIKVVKDDVTPDNDVMKKWESENPDKLCAECGWRYGKHKYNCSKLSK